MKFNEIIKLWKSHSIRTVRNSECPSGRPLVTIDAPERHGAYEMGKPLDLNDLSVGKAFSQVPLYFGCPAEFFRFASVIMRQNNLQMPKSIFEAYNLYVTLINQ